ncbi:pyruvate dehydrogenase E1 component subunit alpha [Candidatus Caldarchaeum subterraneum]|uniref:Pyruvate dehydrogenase E1 component subunit alpha n=1 Tax=Caldiarchaeum subterraneum TaxID=311458 RepID=E6N4T7_CALS0|nr:pyruvate dehydrogenase E1 component subunit alpha [Candidatus Caldarchaeum subterraneum]BAJ50112.1 pyruvate dehydrogenase E1 component subunit alpha [Candidatus Caldarchaeum subterraneum]
MSGDSEAELGLYRVLSPEGELVGEPDPSLSNETMRKMMRDMVVLRAFDQWMLKIHPLGKASRYAPVEGQEASVVGSVHSLSDVDWTFPTYRELTVGLLRGAPLTTLIHRMFATSLDHMKGHEITLYGDKRYRIVVGAGAVSLMCPVAVGMAMAAKKRGEKEVFLVYLGDGATSKGDFHEAINWAGVFKPPVIFFVQNNQWAISIPFKKQTASPTIAVKAKAYGIPGIRVDGNDVLAVYTVCRRFVEKARAGEGAVLIEAVTYRMGPHTTADDPSKYRSEKEVEEMRAFDPLKRMRIYLTRNGLWSPEEEQKIVESFRDELRRATEEAEKTPPPHPRVIFEDVYAELPWHLSEEMAELG